VSQLSNAQKQLANHLKGKQKQRQHLLSLYEKALWRFGADGDETARTDLYAAAYQLQLVDLDLLGIKYHLGAISWTN